MSYLVADPRGRASRSKSPGRRERSTSRAPAPPPPPPVQAKKDKKYYESDSSEASSENDADRRPAPRRHEEPKYAEIKPRRASSPVHSSSARGGKHVAVDLRYEPETRDGRHPSYAQPSQYKYEKTKALVRQPSSSDEESEHERPQRRQEYAPPGQYKHEYDEPDPRDRSVRPPPLPRPEQARNIAMNTSGNFHVEIGHKHQQPQQPLQYMQPASPQEVYYQPTTTTSKPPHGYYERPESPDRRRPHSPDRYRPHSPDRHGKHSSSVPSAGQHYEVPKQYQYAQPSQQITYINKSDSRKPQYVSTSHPHIDVAIDTGVEVRRQSNSQSEHDRQRERERERHEREREKERERRERKSSHAQHVEPQITKIKPGGSLHAPLSPSLGPRMHRLSVSGGQAGALTLIAPGSHGHQGGLPPGSPLLEAYHGTYQSISPMPSPMMLASGRDDDLSDLEPLEGDTSSDDSTLRKPKKASKKRASIYDPEPHALLLAASLKHTKPDPEPIIDILPHLSDDNMMALRIEYKKHIKAGGKGINIAKHIKLKVTGNLGKIAYATALGRWEGEAHWANFWYQSGTSRRELLIESLMGRTNQEIRKIKQAFSDKRYNDSLEKCMQTELKKDKFRNAVLLALEERRMDELSPLSKTQIKQDAQDLYRALVSKDGGETAMIDIIVVRSDRHMQEVLREFENRFQRNFAREMIQKSRNLVGETLAHILNGVLNRPVRDALLLHQALAETSKDRTELLISRLVRFHWEPKHLERVKIEYKRKYGSRLEVDLEAGTKGDFGEFCLALSEGR